MSGAKSTVVASNWLLMIISEKTRQQLLDNNLRQRVMEAIETLPEREKLVLTLYYQEELNLKEIGAVLEVGESRVSQLRSRLLNGYALNWVVHNVSKCRTLTLTTGVLNDEQHLKRRPLSRYLKDFKHSQTHCAHCRKLLDRITSFATAK